MKHAAALICAFACIAAFAGCSRGSTDDHIAGTWTNHHVVAKQPAIVSMEFLPKNTVTMSDVDALVAAGWHHQTTSTGQYEIIAPGKMKITEELGSAVLDYRVDDNRLILSGEGLSQLLGKPMPPQTLDRESK